ncbi:MAG: hypothetical protein HY423_11510 [Candidatus Lambdaproteobacteria bacterium]|nr:hypothetical protein [Candidatus Lambdaproteobacteria bacterium]
MARFWLAALVGAALTATGCAAPSSSALVRTPPPAAVSPEGQTVAAPAAPPSPAPSPAPPPAPPPATRPAVPGVYILHERDFGARRCAYLGEEVLPMGSGPGETPRARVLLELAHRARRSAGNVVLLRRFSADYAQGPLTAELYRCTETDRRAIYDRALIERRLTVVDR